MDEGKFNFGPGARPFPKPRQSGSLSDEDKFMQTHGGAGSRAIYATVVIIEASLKAVGRIPVAALTTMAGLSRFIPGKPASASATSQRRFGNRQ